MQARGGRHLSLCALAVAGSIALGAAPALASGGVRHAPRHGFGRSTSTNWSGYAVTGTNATDVKGSWTQPSVTCAPGENSWSSPWVGIDGDTSNTVEQIGTDSDCRNGVPTYYAWWEMYPKKLFTISSITVHPGDVFNAEVSYASGSFLLKLQQNTGAPFTISQASSRAARSSVEWIMEGPSSGLLSDFGSVSFNAATATLGGLTASVDQFPNADPITMVTNQGATRAAPSGASGGAFSVTWKQA